MLSAFIKQSLFFSLIVIFNPVFAVEFGLKTCPEVSQIKSVTFIKAETNPLDSTLWYLTSGSFSYANLTWTVSFGTFFPEITNPAEAIKEGQRYFDQSPLVIKYPRPVKVPNGIFCSYMPEGRLYFISALGI